MNWDGQDFCSPVFLDHFIRFKGNSFVLAFEMTSKLISFGSVQLSHDGMDGSSWMEWHVMCHLANAPVNEFRISMMVD